MNLLNTGGCNYSTSMKFTLSVWTRDKAMYTINNQTIEGEATFDRLHEATKAYCMLNGIDCSNLIGYSVTLVSEKP